MDGINGFFFEKVLDVINKSRVLTHVERIGLRYINVFHYRILDKINLDIKINNSDIIDEPTNLRTEIRDDNLIKVLQVANSIDININNKIITGSISS